MMIVSRRRFSLVAIACISSCVLPNFFAIGDTKKGGKKSFSLALIEEVEGKSLEGLSIEDAKCFGQITVGPYIVSKDAILT